MRYEIKGNLVENKWSKQGLMQTNTRDVTKGRRGRGGEKEVKKTGERKKGRWGLIIGVSRVCERGNVGGLGDSGGSSTSSSFRFCRSVGSCEWVCFCACHPCVGFGMHTGGIMDSLMTFRWTFIIKRISLARSFWNSSVEHWDTANAWTVLCSAIRSFSVS